MNFVTNRWTGGLIALCGIDRIGGEYQYEYLKEDKIRGSILFGALKPFLKANDIFLDVNCGYSPMAEHIVANGYKITGFDIHREPIEYLKSKFPGGDWQQTPYENIHFQGFSVMLLLGFSITSHGKGFLDFLESNIVENQPRLIATEVYKKKDDFSTSYQEAYRAAVDLIKKYEYVVCASGEYDAQLEVASRRMYEIWNKPPDPLF